MHNQSIFLQSAIRVFSVHVRLNYFALLGNSVVLEYACYAEPKLRP